MRFTLPLCRIPPEILENYSHRVHRFYEQRRDQQVEAYRRRVEEDRKLQFRNLHWSIERGLANISLSPDIGLDLQDGRYVFHNLEDTKSNEAQALFEIAERYVRLLGQLPNVVKGLPINIRSVQK